MSCAKLGRRKPANLRRCVDALGSRDGREVSLSDLLRQYKREHRDRIAAESEAFHDWPINTLIEETGNCKRADGSHHPHLYRIPKRARRAAVADMKMQIEKLRCAITFEDLHDTLGAIAVAIRGLGAVWIYDTALAFGAARGLWPRDIYLHAGTAEGARNFGFRGGRWPPEAWPQEFHDSGLSADDLESFLCGYKRELKLLKRHGAFARQPR